MEKPIIDPEEWLVSLHDVKRLYISMWRRLFKWAILGAIISYLYFGNSEIVYQAEGSFKEGAERIDQGNVFKEFIVNTCSQTSSTQAATFMKSNQVLRPLAEKLGLQIQLDAKEWTLAKWLRRYCETWKAERGYRIKELDPFVFSDVKYDGDGISFQIAFMNEDEFTVYSPKKKKELAKGKLGKPCSFKGVAFTLQNVPETKKLHKFYPFVAGHWASATAALKKKIKIKTDKENKAILIISATDRDRYLAQEIVNELMVEFQAYLKREYDTVANAQLAYLERKQEQVFGKMDALFDEHMDYLSQNLEKNGYLGIEQESQSLLSPHHQMQNKLLAIDVEFKWLDEIEKEGKIISIAEEGAFSHIYNQFTQRIQDLKQQRDLIELSLTQGTELKPQARKDELKEVRDARVSVEKFIQEVDCGGKVSACDLSPGLATWANALTDSEDRKDLAEYLENYARLLSMREKMLQERFFYGKETPKELEGIDIISAKELFLEYNSKLDAAEAHLRTYAGLKKEIQNPYFDLAPLSSVLSDVLSQKIIAEASALEVRLKDEKHHSAKEEGRWKEELALQKKVLTDHLDQLTLVEELNADLMREKMSGLQKVGLDCIHQQISVLHEQMRDAIKERRKALLVEREILQKKIGEIRAVLANIMPEKWRFEKWLSIKTGMINKIMETMTEVVESKSMSNQLHHIESKPLDCALLPSTPLSSHLKEMTLLGAFAFPFLTFSFAFIGRLLKGFPATIEKLKAIRIPLLGEISAFCDGKSVDTPTGSDLETLRNMALFSEGAKVVGLIGGSGPDYSYALCENLARRQAKTIVVRCDFLSKMRREDAPGLFQIWKGEIGELPIRQGKGFDFITAGDTTPYGTEIIQSSQFEELLSLLKKNYDWVFLLLKSPLSSIESQAALRLSDKAIVTISGEQIEKLTPFVHWGYDGESCRITFITAAS